MKDINKFIDNTVPIILFAGIVVATYRESVFALLVVMSIAYCWKIFYK